MRPNKCNQNCDRNHDEETNHDNKGRPLEYTEIIRQLQVIELIVQIYCDTGDQNRSNHSGIQRFDTGNHGKTAGAAYLCGKIKAQRRSELV